MRAGRSGLLLAAAFVALPLMGGALAGCGSSNGTPPHNAEEQKAVEQAKNMTPEQQIAAAENSPMSRDQKDTMIRSIKEKSGIK